MFMAFHPTRHEMTCQAVRTPSPRCARCALCVPNCSFHPVWHMNITVKTARFKGNPSISCGEQCQAERASYLQCLSAGEAV